MARIYPFRALRYNPSLVRLEDVVTQPYDKITPAMQQAYYARSPYNLVRIVLGLPELFDVEGSADVYTRAARDFRDWRESGILAQENEPCIFAYSQRFTVPGSAQVYERRGFIALGELYDYAQNVVFPHEKTLDRPKSDRFRLLQATRAHFGQIFMLYSDPGLTAEKILYSGNAVPEIEVSDEYGTTHRVWKVSDPSTINILAGAMEDKKLIIADGHHRYETALAYARGHAPASPSHVVRNPANTSAQPPYPEAAAMMTFINMDAEGLVILPTHRVVFGLKNFSISEFRERASKFYEIAPLAAPDPSKLTARLSTAKGIAYVAVTREGCFLLTAKTDAVAAALPGISERHRRLDVVQLHSLILQQILGISEQAVSEQQHVRYVREPAEAMDQVADAEADIAFLLNPVTAEQLREVAFAGEVMPQKSTDFFPKLLSGLAIYALD